MLNDNGQDQQQTKLILFKKSDLANSNLIAVAVFNKKKQKFYCKNTKFEKLFVASEPAMIEVPSRVFLEPVSHPNVSIHELT